MESFKEIKNKVSIEDYRAVAAATGYSLHTVRAIVYGQRKDRRNVKVAFNILLKQREELKNKLKSFNQ